MIYAKIYLDNEDVVIDSIKKPIDYTVYLAGPYRNGRGELVSNPFTTIAQTSNVAISQEAKGCLEEILSYTNENFVASMFEGQIQLCYNMKAREGDRGILSFMPDKGKTSCRIDPKGKVYLCYQNGFDIRALDDMKILNNEFLKDLDLSEPFDETKVHEEQGAEPGKSE